MRDLSNKFYFDQEKLVHKLKKIYEIKKRGFIINLFGYSVFIFNYV